MRVKLTDGRMRRHFDSMDICQSVLGSFFVRVAAGQFDLESPQQLVALLTRMAQNKLLMQIRQHHQQRRDVSKVTPLNDDVPQVADKHAGPATVAENRENLSLLLDRLPPAERELAQRRMLGQSWDEIAAAVGGTPQALRMRLSRAVDQVSADLNLDDCASGIEVPPD